MRHLEETISSTGHFTAQVALFRRVGISASIMHAMTTGLHAKPDQPEHALVGHEIYGAYYNAARTSS